VDFAAPARRGLGERELELDMLHAKVARLVATRIGEHVVD
jgi:hypothetical protein